MFVVIDLMFVFCYDKGGSITAAGNQDNTDSEKIRYIRVRMVAEYQKGLFFKELLMKMKLSELVSGFSPTFQLRKTPTSLRFTLRSIAVNR